MQPLDLLNVVPDRRHRLLNLAHVVEEGLHECGVAGAAHLYIGCAGAERKPCAASKLGEAICERAFQRSIQQRVNRIVGRALPFIRTYAVPTAKAPSRTCGAADGAALAWPSLALHTAR